MNLELQEKFTAQVYLYLLPLATIFILTDSVSDPVNVTKFLSVGLVAFGLAANVLFYGPKLQGTTERIFVISLLVLFGALLSTFLFSGAPITQGLYGVYGRNTGLITYITLIFLAVGVLQLAERSSFQKFLHGVLLTGAANIVYSAWVLAFGDPFPWNNIYGSILGFFGNPDFISAFLGIFVTVVLSLIVAKDVDWRVRALGAVSVLVALFEIYKSHAQQGFVVTAIGVAFIGFNLIRSHSKLQGLTLVYVALVFVSGVAGILGSLNHGPLSVLHKQSVIFRGWYWNTAISMGVHHPLTGVGLDGYGDWYRRARSVEAATSSFGPSKVSDAAHSVPLDMFASGGFPLLLTYLFVLGVAVRAIVVVIQRSKSYDPVFVAIAGAWIAYQAQSLISLNQIGLAAWGWALTGALVAYEVSTRSRDVEKEEVGKGKKIVKSQKAGGLVAPQVTFLLGAVVGLIVLLPPFLADTQWRSAVKSQNLVEFEAAMKTGYFAPANTSKYVNAISIYDSNKYFGKAHALNVKALAFNPDSFTLWKLMYNRSNSTPAEKAEALQNLHRLDPHNADVTAP